MALAKLADSQATRDAITELATGANATATNDAATAGNLGENLRTLVAVGAPVALTTATAANVATVSLTAGDWSVSGHVTFSGASSTVTVRSAGINTTSATVPTDGTEAYNGHLTTTTSEKTTVACPAKRISVASTTSVYLVASATYSAGTMGSYGFISAVRVR